MKRIKNSWRQIVGFLLTLGFILLAFSGYLTTMLSGLMDPMIEIQTIVSERFSNIVTFFTIPREVTQLQAENQALLEEVALLRTEIIQLEQDLRETAILYSLLGSPAAGRRRRISPLKLSGRIPRRSCNTF